MIVEAQVEPEDIADFLRSVQPSPSRFSNRTAILILAGISFIGLFLIVEFLRAFVSIDWREQIWALLDQPSLMFLVVLCFALTLLMLWMIRDNFYLTRNHIKVAKDDILSPGSVQDGINIGTTEFEIRPEGLRVATSLRESRYEWTAFRGHRESESGLFLMLGDKTAIVLPKTSFADRTEMERFLAGFERCLGETA